MSRQVSSALRESVNRSETDTEICLLLTFTHADLTDPIRVTNVPLIKLDELTYGDDVFGVISRGETFIALDFEFQLPDETDALSQTVPLRIENVGRDLVEPIFKISSPPSVLLEAVLSVSPNDVEFTLSDLVLRSAVINAAAISGELAADDVTREPYPKDRFTPSRFPGVFKGIQ